MKRKIFIVNIEPLDNRYTKQWYTHIPTKLQKQLPEFEVISIDGDNRGYHKPTTGKFFDFTSTCQYKNGQGIRISQLFNNKEVNNNDIFFFTDAWNPTIHTVKYISQLTGIPVKTVGIWHAGWYDETDILAETITDVDWVKPLELSMYNAYDINFFGTRQHLNKFASKHDINRDKSFVTGYPLDYLNNIDVDYNKKEDIIVFPHRLNDDKAPYVFDHIRDYLHKKVDYKFIKTQEHNLSKDEYYDLLSRSKVVFSCSKHENLGIGTFEAMSHGCIPVVPDKLSYHEMYPMIYRYMIDENMYDDLNSWNPIADKIMNLVHNYSKNTYDTVLQDNKRIYERFFSSDEMFYMIGRM